MDIGKRTFSSNKERLAPISITTVTLRESMLGFGLHDPEIVSVVPPSLCTGQLLFHGLSSESPEADDIQVPIRWAKCLFCRKVIHPSITVVMIS